MNITWADILNGISLLLGYLVFYMLGSNMKIIRWASQKIGIAIVTTFIAIMFSLISMSIIRSIGIKGVYYNLLDGFLMGLSFGATFSIFYKMKIKEV
ncbi:hypothetical protein [Candidatus Clostridium stratigraminis]|uniref:Uncharacterized protein n=1 Tax=Candidatus Clostridium stratigraminis TaxID=3381661 RepID=A0ABW8T0H4_9CLOT